VRKWERIVGSLAVGGARKVVIRWGDVVFGILLEKEGNSVYPKNHMTESLSLKHNLFILGRLTKKGLSSNLSVAYCKKNFMAFNCRGKINLYGVFTCKAGET